MKGGEEGEKMNVCVPNSSFGSIEAGMKLNGKADWKAGRTNVIVNANVDINVNVNTCG
jgi:hypothetical protein